MTHATCNPLKQMKKKYACVDFMFSDPVLMKKSTHDSFMEFEISIKSIR